ncbi:hypothetical protein T06_5088 [Trichinella sp. T6]|nr:hypothetical protein T06_5088 [Trichinella sp. T6]
MLVTGRNTGENVTGISRDNSPLELDYRYRRGRPNTRRKTRRPTWLQDFIQTQVVSTGRALHEGESSATDMDRVNEISPAENEEEEN